jgi:small subunit ribosomal protein S16
MAVKMRLTRMGDKKSPFYRIVVIDSRKTRDGEYIDLIGTYAPIKQPAETKINVEKAKEWLSKGVQPTDTVRSLLVAEGILQAKPVKKTSKKTLAKEAAAKAEAEKAAKEAEKPAESAE